MGSPSMAAGSCRLAAPALGELGTQQPRHRLGSSPPGEAAAARVGLWGEQPAPPRLQPQPRPAALM